MEALAVSSLRVRSLTKSPRNCHRTQDTGIDCGYGTAQTLIALANAMRISYLADCCEHVVQRRMIAAWRLPLQHFGHQFFVVCQIFHRIVQCAVNTTRASQRAARALSRRRGLGAGLAMSAMTSHPSVGMSKADSTSVLPWAIRYLCFRFRESSSTQAENCSRTLCMGTIR